MTNNLIFRKWIDINKIKWDWLSMNPNAIHLLDENNLLGDLSINKIKFIY